ncbi:addiction module antidote protein, HigA family [Anabaena sp. UHCC 0451]|uniref:helix-turn-helix transcriptional regulator n=1 Tax=Anabaena sp. UHCC 0451 TaxID=2055235 RepID=UPI002B20AA01|nr:addiction module antidote protein, HigA family [Anabaena sp. UHCC 0451]MEA5576099.1 addiction module antidote protein, HigA family [Anabaena sp. UHCC 0451]
MENNLLYNLHAGEILKYQFLEELDISENTLAVNLGLTYPTIQGNITGRLKITADINLCLWLYFRFSDGYFLRL